MRNKIWVEDIQRSFAIYLLVYARELRATDNRIIETAEKGLETLRQLHVSLRENLVSNVRGYCAAVDDTLEVYHGKTESGFYDAFCNIEKIITYEEFAKYLYAED